MYDGADIGALDGGGLYSHQATLIIHTYTDDLATEKDDIDTIIDFDNDGIVGLFITDVAVANNPYGSFPAAWMAFCKRVAKLVRWNS